MNPDIQNADHRFLDLISENQPRILKVCRVYAWNREDQDDLYQEILFQIWRSLPKLKEPAYANTWLYRTALNTAMSFVRKQATRKSRTVNLDHDQLHRVLDSRTPHVPAANEPLAKLYQAIARLDDVEKALVTLFLEDLSYDQMAEVMGVTSSHVGVMLHRAKKKLSVLMEEASHE